LSIARLRDGLRAEVFDMVGDKFSVLFALGRVVCTGLRASGAGITGADEAVFRGIDDKSTGGSVGFALSAGDDFSVRGI